MADNKYNCTGYHLISIVTYVRSLFENGRLVCLFLYRMCTNHHSSQSTCIAAEGNANENGSVVSGSGSHASGSEIPRRYCPCCYCELFGHNGVSALAWLIVRVSGHVHPV